MKSIEEIINIEDSSYWGNALQVSHTVIPYWHYRDGYIKLLSQMLYNDTLAIIRDRLSQQMIQYNPSDSPSDITNDSTNDITNDSTNPDIYPNNAGIKGSTQIIHVLFSAHGVPKSYVDTYNDPYQSQIEESVLWTIKHMCNNHAVTKEGFIGISCGDVDYSTIASVYNHNKDSYSVDIGENAYELHFHLSYQSKVGPVEWLK